MTGNTVLRLGLIGTGQMAAHYAHSWVSMPEVAFVALSDVNAGSRRKFVDICRRAGRPEPREFDDFKSMLTTCRDELDAIYVCTPHALHAEQGIAVVESGLDLLIEKPMVTTVAEAERLIAARDQSGSTVAVAFQGALSPLIADTRQRAQAGEFGELLSVAAHHLGELVLKLRRSLEAAIGLVGRRLYVRYRRPHDEHRLSFS